MKKSLKISINKNIPAKISSTKRHPPWINTELRRCIRNKQRLYNRAKLTDCNMDWNRFKLARRTVDRRIRHAHWDYVGNVIGGSLETNNTKPFWNYIKSAGKQAFSIPALRSNQRLVSSPEERAEALNNQFKSVFTTEDLNTVPTLGNQHTTQVMPDILVTQEGVRKLLGNLKINKAPGPDGLPARVLQECSASLAPILTHIFNKSLSSGMLPKDWSEANVTPIYKKGEKSDPANYRPVSLTSISCKVLEHIIHRSIMNHLDCNSLLTNLQHGFRTERSCESQLATVLQDLNSSVDKGKQVDALVLDFSKAFDTVPHRRLLYKLKRIGISCQLLQWIEHFLTNRHQQVVVDGKSSS